MLECAFPLCPDGNRKNGSLNAEYRISNNEFRSSAFDILRFKKVSGYGLCMDRLRSSPFEGPAVANPALPEDT